jgi:hypothetical protein
LGNHTVVPSFIGVITSLPQTRRQIARALYSGGMELRFTERPSEISHYLANDRPELMIVDVDSLEGPAVDQVLAALANAQRKVPAILLSLGSDKESLLSLLRRYDLGNLVAKHGAIRAVYPVLDERELLVTCNKVVRADLFGLEKYIGSWSVKIHEFPVRSMAEKYRVMSEFEGFLTDIEVPQVVVPDMITVADELMLNAIVHAPRKQDGTPKYEDRGPDPKLELTAEEQVDVQFACDGQRLMLSVSDRFGTLGRDTVYNYLAKAFGAAKQRVEQKTSGAGLGLSMSFRRVHQMVFNIHELVRTEVIAGWYLRVESASEFRQVSKSMNLFWLPAPADRQRATPPPPAQVVPLAPVPAPPIAPPPRPVGQIARKRLTGRVDERFKIEPGEGPLRLDMRALTGITSSGVLAWLKTVQNLQGRYVELVAFPEFMVRAACEVEGLLSGVVVRSVLAPFECRRCAHVVQTERLPDEVVVGEAPTCTACNGPMVFSGIDWEYQELVKLLAPAQG